MRPRPVCQFCGVLVDCLDEQPESIWEPMQLIDREPACVACFLDSDSTVLE